MNTNAPVINLNISDVLAIHFESFKGLLSQTVSTEQALARTLKNFAGDIASQREDTKAAWAEMAKYKHPKSGRGQLKDLAERAKRYAEEGLRDAKELTEINNRIGTPNEQRGDKTRKAELLNELNKDQANTRSAQDALASAEELYKQWKDRFEQRNTRLEEMKAEYEALEKEGPMWLAQIRDSQKAEAAADADANKDESTITLAQKLRADLKSKAEMATLREEAGNAVDDDGLTLDEEIAARENEQAGNNLIAEWMKKASK